MIISAASDYRAAAQRILPPFLFHYVALRQRILRNMSDLSLETTLFNEKLAMPTALAPVGLCGMYARRGEVQAAGAADEKGIPFTLSTVSVCPIEEVAPTIKRPMWFQLYVLRDRGFMRNALERAKAAGCSTLVFTVDMPTPGARYRDAHSGMSGPNAAMRRYWQAVTHPQWAWDVGLNGRPHDLGNISAYLGKPTGLEDYIVKGDITILADSGIRNGLDVVRMIALGADSVLLGRAYLYALATHGKQGVANLLNLIEKEMKVAMTLTGTKTIGEISRESLVQNADALRTFDVIKAGNAAVTSNPEGTVRQAG